MDHLMNESVTVTIVGMSNMPGSAVKGMSAQSVNSYSIRTDSAAPSCPLSEGAIRVGNTLLTARVAEDRFLRDDAEEL